MFQTKSCTGNQNTHFMVSNSPPQKNRAIYEITWEKKKCGILATLMTIQYGARASHVWITKTTDTHLEYVIFTAFRGSNGYANAFQMLRYTYIVCRILV